MESTLPTSVGVVPGMVAVSLTRAVATAAVLTVVRLQLLQGWMRPTGAVARRLMRVLA